MTATAYERLTDRLHDLGKLVKTNGRPNQAKAQCPAHDDRNPSLSITGIEGQVLAYCHAGCPIEAVLDALGMTKSDLYDEPRGATYVYEVTPGQILRAAHRSPEKKFWQSGDTQSQPILYRLPQVAEAVAASRTIYLVEGEKDVHALESIGLVATTAPMGAENFHKVDVTPLIGAHVIAIPDRDTAGQKWAQQVSETLNGKAASLEFWQAKTGKDAADHIAAGHGPNEFEPAEVEDANTVVRRALPRIDWHELWADEEDEEYVHHPLVPRRRLIAIYSPPKIGKSLITLELAAAISCGQTVLGHTPTKRWRVLYVDFENDPRGDIRTRLQDMGYKPDDLTHLDYLSFPSLSHLDSERGGLELLAAINAYDSEFVVIDTISRAVGGEENSNDTWLDFYRHTGLKLKQAGVSLLRLDHTGKDEGKGQRGGSAKSGDVDAVWRLTKITDEHFRLECTDARFQLDVKSLHLTRQSDPLRHTVDNLSAVTEREAKIAHIVDLANEAGLPADAPREDIQKLAKAHGIKARTTLYAEVVKRRRNGIPEKFSVPSQGNSSIAADSSNTRDTDGNSAEQHTDSRSNSVPDPWEQTGTEHIGSTVPVPSSLGGNSGTTEQTQPNNANPLITDTSDEAPNYHFAEAMSDTPTCWQCGKELVWTDEQRSGVCSLCAPEANLWGQQEATS
jgi:5S rRNA maturation endonuclease (ribonuclease M5)